MKAQAMSIDMLVALGAFMFTLLILMVGWQTLSTHGQTSAVQDDIDRIVQYNSLILMSTPGVPPTWDNVSLSNISAIGFVDANGVLSMDKLTALNRTDLSANVTELLGFSGPNYNYFITVKDNDATVLTRGVLPTSSAFYSGVREYYMHNGTTVVKVRIGVWV